ncbi:MAG: TPM domain-containing protein [Actinobacteria bacterium]|nr:TPM domain-containing protein [Actinomycetota bacterium]
MAESKQDNKKTQNPYQAETEIQKSKPDPVADRTYFVFNDLKKGQVKHSHFILRNIGGSYSDFELFISDPDSFLKIVDSKPLNENQTDKLPLRVCFEAEAPDWSKQYTNTIIFRLDGEEEKITVDLDTQTRPVNDFSGIFSPSEIKKMTSLIEKLEKSTSAEIAVVSLDSMEGKTIEKYANELFNEWGIGKENIHNGILFLINTDESKYRIEVGLGLEELLTEDFINGLFSKYIVPYFRMKKFGKGVYLVLSEIYAKIYRKYKKK